MIKFTDFIKEFTEGKQSKIKFKFHMSTKFLDLNKSPYDCLIEDAEDWQNLNNYRNEKGKSSRLIWLTRAANSSNVSERLSNADGRQKPLSTSEILRLRSPPYMA